MKPPLSDVAVRARGLAGHLLSEESLRRLARSSTSGVLAGALQTVGYWPAPTAAGSSLSTAETIEAAIEHEVTRRLGVLARWLGGRRALFVGVFEYEERRSLRFWLRCLFAPEEGPRSRRLAPSAGFVPLRVREEFGNADDVGSLVRALRRAGSPYADPLAAALHTSGEDRAALEASLDRTFAARALRAAERIGGRLIDWVRDEIDLQNAWSALAGGAGDFIVGGRSLTAPDHEGVIDESSLTARRRRLRDVFARSRLAPVFDDPDLSSAALEARSLRTRIAAERRAARLDPLGAAPILEVVMRLREERAELRRINWGIAQARPAEVIIGQMPRRA